MSLTGSANISTKADTLSIPRQSTPFRHFLSTIMQFTTREMKMMELLRKQQRQWPIARWLGLFNGLLISGLSAYVFFIGIHHYRENSRLSEIVLSEVAKLPPGQQGKHVVEMLPLLKDQAVEVALFFPIWLLFVLMGLFQLATVAIHWRGHANDVLLLKLVEAQQNKPISETPAAGS